MWYVLFKWIIGRCSFFSLGDIVLLFFIGIFFRYLSGFLSGGLF